MGADTEAGVAEGCVTLQRGLRLPPLPDDEADDEDEDAEDAEDDVEFSDFALVLHPSPLFQGSES